MNRAALCAGKEYRRNWADGAPSLQENKRKCRTTCQFERRCKSRTEARSTSVTQSARHSQYAVERIAVPVEVGRRRKAAQAAARRRTSLATTCHTAENLTKHSAQMRRSQSSSNNCARLRTGGSPSRPTMLEVSSRRIMAQVGALRTETVQLKPDRFDGQF